MAAKKVLSKSGICEAYGLAEATLAHLEDLDLFDSSDGKVVRGERRYVISSALEDVFSLARAHYPSIRTVKTPLFPYQRAIVFYLLSRGPAKAYQILIERGFIQEDRPSRKYFTTLFNNLVAKAPKSIKKWVKGEQEEPTKSNAKAVELYLDILGITDFWEDPDQVELSFLYDDILVRQALESLLCTQAKYDEIADVISVQFDMHVDKVDVEIYNQFYFDRFLPPTKDWKKWLMSLSPNHQGHIWNSMNLTFAEYARKYRVAKHLDTTEEIDAMLAVSQQGFWAHKEAASHGSSEAIKKQQILINNSLKLFEARLSLSPTDVGTVNDRLKLEFEQPKDLKIVNREEFEPNEIDSPKVSKEAGLRDPTTKEQGA